ncbi:hypothetical protein TNIN_462481 [Trichonephila inaurata madagascariensis]|uniref:Uncharacterized protein n=1 Tax=Trichonephila inaurata madagascariensis TaxID=2747483 RepID=A0A8X6I950_9ARAC|nr:hypothetical protein TNIN_462481 [Trichonephila inaurata madagascariensis]
MIMRKRVGVPMSLSVAIKCQRFTRMIVLLPELWGNRPSGFVLALCSGKELQIANPMGNGFHDKGQIFEETRQ